MEPKIRGKYESLFDSRRFKLAVISAACVFFSEYFGIELSAEIKAQLMTAITGMWIYGDTQRKTE